MSFDRGRARRRLVAAMRCRSRHVFAGCRVVRDLASWRRLSLYARRFRGGNASRLGIAHVPRVAVELSALCKPPFADLHVGVEDAGL
eukprot:3918761-Pleurochrysis_carterae.AAC.1